MTFAARSIGRTGGVSAFVFSPVIASDTSNYNMRAAAVSAGWDQVVPLTASVTVNSGIVVSASTTAGWAFDTGVTFPAGSTIAVINNGYIVGMGGNGGTGTDDAYGGAGGNAGPGLRAQYATTITNNGIIGGGGGGGSGGGSGGEGYLYGSGGGGGQTGRTNTAGGVCPTDGARSGSNGTWSGPGVGKPYYDDGGEWAAAGGNGGGWGSTGGWGGLGESYDDTVIGTAGGSGGAAVSGNANITWAVAGARYGSLT